MGSDIAIYDYASNKPLTRHYNGLDINATAGSRTVQNENLVPGAVLQMSPHPDQDGFNEAEVFSIPTTGVNTPCGVVSPGVGQHELAVINKIDPAVANKRVGGAFPMLRAGIYKVLVKANCTKGATQLCPVDGEYHLEAYSAGAAGAIAAKVGAGGRPFAVALETVDTSVTRALVKCLVFGDGQA
jgi:hypothetical protein